MDNTIKPNSPVKKLNPKVIGIILAAVILIVLAVVLSTNQKKVVIVSPVNNSSTTTESVAPASGTSTTPTSPAASKIPEGTRTDATGANLITKDNKVITQTGEATNNGVGPMSPLAPQVTVALQKDQLSSAVLKLNLSAGSFTPNQITTKAGAPTTISVTSLDGAHTFLFDDSALSAINMGINPGETRAVTFNAPTKAGEYTFRCNIPGHDTRGEVGKLIVK